MRISRLVLVCLIFCAPAAKATIKCPEKSGLLGDCSVLLVHSYHPGLEWVQILSENITRKVTNSAQVRIDTEFLDAKRHPSLEHAQTFLEILGLKYNSQPPDVLVISDDPAFDLLWPIREELFGDVPIVFMGLNGQRDELSAGVTGITGIFEEHATEKTVELALELTDASGIVVLNDTSETGKANELKLEEVVDANPGIRWIVERDLSVEDIDRIASWPEDWPIITMLPLRESRQNNAMLSQRRSVEVLRQALPNPLFYDSEWMMGSGLVGGYALSGSDHAEQAGELVLEILQGSKPVNLPFRVETKHQWIFDQRELNRFDWSHDVLPQSAVIQHAEIDFWQRHRQVIYPLLLALAISALIIVLLGLTVSHQRRTETQLLLQKQRLSAALSASHAGVFEIRPHWRYASPRWLELMNLESHEESEDIDEDWMRNATSDSRKLYNEALRRLAGESDRERIELIIKGDRPRILDVLLTNSRNKTNQPGAIVGVATDITATRQLEDEAARRNRLELLGELAGGIAHDFNNYLLVINSNADTAKKLDNPEEIRELITEIEKAGDRANDTVKQLLSFGKNDPKSEKVIDMNEAVRRSHSFLQRIVGKSSEIVVTLYSEPLGVRIDRPQMERVLSNLVLNARDAISNGSAINLEVRLKTIDFVEYVVVIVRDEGQGMSEAISDHVFEPFYTTKGVDEGTGLGLSTVYGIVKGSGGKVSVKSQPGVGTVFELVWPREEYVGSATPAAVVRQDKFDEKTILVVEDDPHVGLVTRRLLEDTGFSVFLAEDGKAGLKTFSERPKKWDLVLSDVVLPELNGIEMMSEIKRLNPSVKVGFISGFTDHSSLCGTRLPPNAPLLKKPYSRNELQLYVEGLLDETVSSNEVALT